MAAAVLPAEPLDVVDGHAHAALLTWGFEPEPSRHALEHMYALHSAAADVPEKELKACRRLQLLALTVHVLNLIARTPSGCSAALADVAGEWLKEVADMDQALQLVDGAAWLDGLHQIRDVGEEARASSTQPVEPPATEEEVDAILCDFVVTVGHISRAHMPKPKWLPPNLDTEIAQVEADEREARCHDASRRESIADRAADACAAATAGTAQGRPQEGPYSPLRDRGGARAGPYELEAKSEVPSPCRMAVPSAAMTPPQHGAGCLADRVSEAGNDLFSAPVAGFGTPLPLRLQPPHVAVSRGGREAPRLYGGAAPLGSLAGLHMRCRQNWSQGEEERLVEGYTKYPGRWESIRHEFGLMHRSGVHLKDKFRNLHKAGKISGL